MKQKLTEEIKELFSQSINWAKLEVEYVKLTAAEKLIILLSALIIGGVMMLLLLPVFIMFLFALVSVFKTFLNPTLSYLCVGGIVLILTLALFFFRKALVINPVSRFVTKVIIEKHTTKTEEK